MSSALISFLRFANRLRPLDFLNHAVAKVLPPTWYEFQPGLWMKLDLRDMVQETIALTGGFDPGMTGLLPAILKLGDAFIDIGANVGLFSLLASRLVGPAGRVLAIEANPAVADLLEANIERNHLVNVCLERVACSACEGVLTFSVPPRNNSGMGTLAPMPGAATIEVKATSLDALVLKHSMHPRLVKIDVEGAELSVLRGMEHTLRDLRPILALEVESDHLARFSSTPTDIDMFLSHFGYRKESMGQHHNFIYRPT